MILRTILLFMLLVATVVRAQETTGPLASKGWGIPTSPLNCEMNFQNLEYVSKLTQQQTTGFLIIVARVGNLETQKDLNKRRLYNVRLKLSLIGVPANRIIVAEGERVRGFGRIEFYLRGELIGALPVPNARDICVGCCDPEDRFYPYKQKRSALTGNHATDTWRADSIAGEVVGQ
jgi:hypothetical protein